MHIRVNTKLIKVCLRFMKIPNWSVAIKMYKQTPIRVNTSLLHFMKTPWSVAIKMYKHMRVRVNSSLSELIKVCLVYENPLACYYHNV